MKKSRLDIVTQQKATTAKEWSNAVAEMNGQIIKMKDTFQELFQIGYGNTTVVKKKPTHDPDTRKTNQPVTPGTDSSDEIRSGEEVTEGI
jgi:hypothetical protein